MADQKKTTLTVAVATYNEESNLDACLASIKDIADEIVVVDGGSGDKTTDIAKQFGARVIVTDNPSIFHINKQKALDLSHSDWILQLDADEIITSELKDEIVGTINNKQKAVNGYYIPRRNFFWGHFMKKGGQYPDYVIRLVRRGKGRFPGKSVHEQIDIDGEVGYLQHPMLHYSYRTRADYWRKADAYTSLTAHKFKEKNVPKTVWSSMYYVFWKPFATCTSIFFRHKGFIDGITGFEFALYSGLHWAMAYRKYLRL